MLKFSSSDESVPMHDPWAAVDLPEDQLSFLQKFADDFKEIDDYKFASGTLERFLYDTLKHIQEDPYSLTLFIVATAQVTFIIASSYATYPSYLTYATKLCDYLAVTFNVKGGLPPLVAKMLAFCTTAVNGPYNFQATKYFINYFFQGCRYLYKNFKEAPKCTGFLASLALTTVGGLSLLATYEQILQALEVEGVFFIISSIAFGIMGNTAGMCAGFEFAYDNLSRIFGFVTQHGSGSCAVYYQSQPLTKIELGGSPHNSTASNLENLKTVQAHVKNLIWRLKNLNKSRDGLLPVAMRAELGRQFASCPFPPNNEGVVDFYKRALTFADINTGRIRDRSFTRWQTLFLSCTAFLSTLGLAAGLMRANVGLGIVSLVSLYGLSLKNAFSFSENYNMPLFIHFFTEKNWKYYLYYFVVLFFSVCAILSFASTGLAAFENLNAFFLFLLVSLATAFENYLPAGLTLAGILSLCLRIFDHETRLMQSCVDTLELIITHLDKILEVIDAEVEKAASRAFKQEMANRRSSVKVHLSEVDPSDEEAVRKAERETLLKRTRNNTISHY